MKGVDVKRFVYYGVGYTGFEGEIRALPENLVKYFEDNLQNAPKPPAPVASESGMWFPLKASRELMYTAFALGAES